MPPDPTDAGEYKWFERVWEQREEVLYPSLFGPTVRGIFPIEADILTETFRQTSFDPRWLYSGVFEFAPTPERASWLYVTSGMSNDWEADHPDATTPSGIGCEFIFETTQQSEWAILRLLHLMTFQILLCHGRYPEWGPLDDFHRIPLGAAICAGNSPLRYLLLAPPPHFPREITLESGSFIFTQVIGISTLEAAYARAHGGPALLELLLRDGHSPITDPSRREVVADQ